jgi:hypothetical protein
MVHQFLRTRNIFILLKFLRLPILYSAIKILCQVKEKIDAVLAERQKLHTAWQHKKVT